MTHLPAHHIRRPRLTDRCADARVVVVVAAGGYGKSVFGTELIESWRSNAVSVELVGDAVPARTLVARWHSAVVRAGYPDAAAAVAAIGDDLPGAVEAMVAALAGENCTFVIDDAHLADPEAAALIEYLAAHVADGQRCVVLARHVPRGASRLRRPDYFQLDAADLALAPGETLELLRSGFGLNAGADEARAIDEATGGWTAAAVLAAARAQRTGEALAVVARAASRPGSPSVTALIEEAIAGLSADDRHALAQVARLPLLDPVVVDAAAGASGHFERAVAAGVPLTIGAQGSWELPGPVRDVLAALAPADSAALQRAAASYASRGDLGAALDLLVDSGLGDAAAATLASAAPAAIEAMDPMELQAIAERIGSAALERHPIVHVYLSRVFGLSAMYVARTETLRRAAALADSGLDPVLRRAVAAERAKEAVTESGYDEAEELASAVLAQAGPDETWTRASALGALGRAMCWHLDDTGRRDLDALRQADANLGSAVDLFRRMGLTGSAVALAPYRAMWIDYALGDPAAGLARIEEAIAQAVDRPRMWASLLNYRFELELELGRFDECDNSIASVRRVAEEYDDAYLRSYASWNQMIQASYLGDAAATLDYSRRCEREASDWWKWASADFHASAAESLARVGETALAYEHLDRALANPQDGEPLIAMAEAVVEARFGDPSRADALLLAAPTRRIDPREFWRLTLFRALAAFRRDDPSAGALAARAFEEASRLGLGHLPAVKERTVTEELLGLAVSTGQPAAVAIADVALPVSMRVLGRFTVTRGGRPVAVTPGQGAQLLKLLAVFDGRLLTERAIDALWPDVDYDAGRHRMRTLLNRLRGEVGDLVVRDGEVLALSSEVRVDLALFEAEAQRALALQGEPRMASALARSAVTRYRGELLPDDPYEEWTERPRERARRLVLDLLDVCADSASARGDLDELRRVVELTIDLAPYDDERYLRAAATLLRQGRRGAALTIVHRARSALAELGLPPSRHLISLEQEIVA